MFHTVELVRQNESSPVEMVHHNVNGLQITLGVTVIGCDSVSRLVLLPEV